VLIKIITLDRDDVVCRAGDRLVVNGEDGKAQARIVSSKIGRKVTVTVAFDSVAVQNVWVVDAQDLKTMKFRVMSITQDDKHQFSITACNMNHQNMMRLILAHSLMNVRFPLLIQPFSASHQCFNFI
jgi:predicted phage tail protein